LKEIPEIARKLAGLKKQESAEIYYGEERIGEVSTDNNSEYAEKDHETHTEWPQAQAVIAGIEEHFGPLSAERIEHIKFGKRRLGIGSQIHIPEEALAPLTEAELKDWGID
jgi:hypothetical protein